MRTATVDAEIVFTYDTDYLAGAETVIKTHPADVLRILPPG